MDNFFATDTKTDPIEITDAAANRLKSILEQEEDDKHLRIGVEGGGCSGLSYTLDFDNETKEYDEEYVVNGVPFILDTRHRMYLEGTRLTFSEGLDNRGFEFENPNASETCGCGSSFSV